MSVTAVRPNPADSIAEDRVLYGAVHLDVSDRDRALTFWSGLVGLQLLSDAGGLLHLGTEDRELLVLHPGADRPTPPGHSGLYHLALHLPSEAEFARALARIAQAGYPQAPTDHVMHWATYLNDPDGIGLELTFETLDRFSHYTLAGGRPMVVGSDGALRRATDQLDLEDVLSHLGDGDLSRPLPQRTRVGHVHLHVGEIEPAVRFYGETIGFLANEYEPLIGMADMRAGGSFPHRLAMNVWAGQGAPQRPAGSAGLRSLELRVRDQARLAAVRERLGVLSGAGVTQQAEELSLRDPSGNALTLSVE